jgi:hypothetical protein
MSAVVKQVNRRRESLSASGLSSETAPWTSGCYARIAGFEAILEIRNRNRLRRLRQLGTGLVILGVATVAVALLSPF